MAMSTPDRMTIVAEGKHGDRCFRASKADGLCFTALRSRLRRPAACWRNSTQRPEQTGITRAQTPFLTGLFEPDECALQMGRPRGLSDIESRPVSSITRVDG